MKSNKLILILHIENDEQLKEFKLNVKNNDKLISEIDFKKDESYHSIDLINEYIIEKIVDYEEIEFKKVFFIEENLLPEAWKKIIELISKTWTDEFNKVKKELTEILNKQNNKF